MAYRKTITTVYDNETNTHWEVGEGDTVESIREVLNCFKQSQDDIKKTTQEKMNNAAKKMMSTNLYMAMDTANKAATHIMATGTEEELLKHMCTDDNGKGISYSEMRSRFG